MKQHFLDSLNALGRKATNKAVLADLRNIYGEALWSLTTYNQIKQELKTDGVIKLGRGRGGTVSFI